MDPIGKAATGLVRSPSGNAAAGTSAAEPQAQPRPERPTGGAIAVLGALGRPPSQEVPDTIGRFSVVGRVGADDMAKIHHTLAKQDLDAQDGCNSRLDFRDGYHTKGYEALFDYYAHDESCKSINSDLRSGQPQEVAEGMKSFMEMAPMRTSLSPGYELNRVLLPPGHGWGQEPLELDAFARMKTQLAAAPAGTVLQDHGLMSTKWGHGNPHNEGKAMPAGVHLLLTAAEPGVRVMGVSETPDTTDGDLVLPPNQKLVLLGSEEKKLSEYASESGHDLSAGDSMLVIRAALLASERVPGLDDGYAPSDGDPPLPDGDADSVASMSD